MWLRLLPVPCPSRLGIRKKNSPPLLTVIKRHKESSSRGISSKKNRVLPPFLRQIPPLSICPSLSCRNSIVATPVDGTFWVRSVALSCGELENHDFLTNAHVMVTTKLGSRSIWLSPNERIDQNNPQPTRRQGFVFTPIHGEKYTWPVGYRIYNPSRIQKSERFYVFCPYKTKKNHKASYHNLCSRFDISSILERIFDGCGMRFVESRAKKKRQSVPPLCTCLLRWSVHLWVRIYYFRVAVDGTPFDPHKPNVVHICTPYSVVKLPKLSSQEPYPLILSPKRSRAEFFQGRLMDLLMWGQ